MTQRMISAGFALAAMTIATVPALAFSVWPDVDFAWYANVGKPTATMEVPTSITAPATAGRNYMFPPGQAETIEPPVVAQARPQQGSISATRNRAFTDERNAQPDRVPSATPEAYPPDSQRR